MRRTNKVLIANIVICAAGVLALILFSTLLKDWIIIGYGVRAFGMARRVSSCVAGFGIGGSLAQGLRLFMANKKQRARQAEKRNRSRVLADYAKDSTNPDLTRRRLQQLQDEIPALEDLVMQCLEQMDAMDALREKQNALIEANDARYLKDTINVLDNVERRICQNFRNVINLCIAADSAESLDEKKVNKYLKDNRKKLSNTKELLKASADWINQYNADEDSDRSEVENWIAVIRDSLREE